MLLKDSKYVRLLQKKKYQPATGGNYLKVILQSRVLCIKCFDKMFLCIDNQNVVQVQVLISTL